MPTVDDLRSWKRWGKMGSTDQEEPMRFLQRQGYKLTREWAWQRPSPSHVVTVEEADAIRFLTERWDFGGLLD